MNEVFVWRSHSTVYAAAAAAAGKLMLKKGSYNATVLSVQEELGRLQREKDHCAKTCRSRHPMIY
jgi:hypothetical protein